LDKVSIDVGKNGATIQTRKRKDKEGNSISTQVSQENTAQEDLTDKEYKL
jgi:hypothetical protein